VFEEAEWEGCRFVRCNFREAVLKEWVTRSSVFEACDFTGAKLNASHHEGTAFLNCRFRGTDLYVSRFASCKMTGSGFEEARMEGMTISGGDWSLTRLVYQDLSGFQLGGIHFRVIHRCRSAAGGSLLRHPGRSLSEGGGSAGGDHGGHSVEGTQPGGNADRHGLGSRSGPIPWGTGGVILKKVDGLIPRQWFPPDADLDQVSLMHRILHPD
jgi:hypothetical protein